MANHKQFPLPSVEEMGFKVIPEKNDIWLQRSDHDGPFDRVDPGTSDAEIHEILLGYYITRINYQNKKLLSKSNELQDLIAAIGKTEVIGQVKKLLADYQTENNNPDPNENTTQN